MRLTILFLLLPVVMFFGFLFVLDHSDALALPLFILWMLTAVVCLAWGFYISRRHRLLGWLCVGVALLQFVLAFLPAIGSHRVD
jgi:hypothetical protein